MRIEVFDDDEWGARVSELWISHMSSHPNARICLAVGETPRPVYTRSAPEVGLSASTIFMLQRDLLGSLNQPPGAYHRLDDDAPNPDAECARFDALVTDGAWTSRCSDLG